MAILIAPARPEDVEPLADLLAELDRFYGVTDEAPLDDRVAKISALLFGVQPVAHVLLAWDNVQLVGLASYSFLWPAAGVTHSLYLKELYVVGRARKRGIGRTLLVELYRIAEREGCSRVEWTADTDNPEALQFYAALGVEPNPTKQSYRVGVSTVLRPIWA